MKSIIILIYSCSLLASVEVQRRDYSKHKITLKIVQAYPDEFNSYKLINHNSREMTLVCRGNRSYGAKDFGKIEYRNFYNEKVGDFIISSNSVCTDMAKFIEGAHSAIDEDDPFIIELDRTKLQVSKVVYPQVDLFTEYGDIEDLLPKEKIEVKGRKAPLRLKVNYL